MAKYPPIEPRSRSTSTWLAATAVLLPGLSLIVIGWIVLRIQTEAIQRQIEDETRTHLLSAVDALETAGPALLRRLRSEVDRFPQQEPDRLKRTPDEWSAGFRRDPKDGSISPLDAPPPTRPLDSQEDTWIGDVLALIEQDGRTNPEGVDPSRFEALLRGATGEAEKASVYLSMIAALARSGQLPAASEAQRRLLAEVSEDAEWNGIPLQLACGLEKVRWSNESGDDSEATTLWDALATDQIPLPRLNAQAHLLAAIDALQRVDPKLTPHGSLLAEVIERRSRIEREGTRLLSMLPGDELLTTDLLSIDGTTHIELIAAYVAPSGEFAGFSAKRADALLPRSQKGFALHFATSEGSLAPGTITTTDSLPPALGGHSLFASADPSLLESRVRPWSVAVTTGSTMVAIMSLVCAIIAIRGVSRRLRYARLRQDLVTSVAHELRTPLTGMMLQLELLEDERLPAEDRRENASRALSAATHLHRLVERVLSLDRSERTPDTDRRNQVSARALLDTASSAIEAVWPELSIRLDVDAAAPDAFVDPDVIQQVLSGVLDNAARYAGSTAPVSIIAKAGPGGTLQLDVVDVGPGVPNDQLERIFEEFHRLDRDHGVEGNGLGLPIARRLMFAAGGTIQAEHAQPTSHEKGLRIVIRMPTRVPPRDNHTSKNQRALA